MGVVTASNTNYFLVIDDEEKFKAFAENLYTGDIFDTKMLNNYSKIYMDLFNIKETNSPSNNENAFLNFLRANNSGLKLIKGNTTMNKWQVLSKDQNNNTIKEDCD